MKRAYGAQRARDDNSSDRRDPARRRRRQRQRHRHNAQRNGGADGAMGGQKRRDDDEIHELCSSADSRGSFRRIIRVRNPGRRRQQRQAAVDDDDDTIDQQAADAAAAAVAEATEMRDKDNMRLPPCTLVARADDFTDDPIEPDNGDGSTFCFLCTRINESESAARSIQAMMTDRLKDVTEENMGRIRLKHLVQTVHKVYEGAVRPHLTHRYGYSKEPQKPEWTQDSIRLHITTHDVTHPRTLLMCNLQIMNRCMHMYDRNKLLRIVDDETGAETIKPDDKAVDKLIKLSKHTLELIRALDRIQRS